MLKHHNLTDGISSPMILLSLASKQIWPQVLMVAQLKPSRVFLLHSQDANESKGPAQRLKRLFDETGLVPLGKTRLEAIPHDNFDGIERALDTLQTNHKLLLEECRLNFTGGNKLMATAAFRWAARRGVSSFYLERGNRLNFIEPRDGEMQTRSEDMKGNLADDLDPVALLKCQIDASEIERPGQSITLNKSVQNLPGEEFFKHIQNGDAKLLLSIAGEADREQKTGDALEFATAATLLKLGVACVQRSLRLKVKSTQNIGTRSPHAEIDLLFIWGGRLWIVDCKDRIPAEDLAEGFRREVGRLSPKADDLFKRIQNELSISQTKAMKEDLLAIREVGGLKGQVICIRKSELPEEVVQYARLNSIEVILKNRLVEGLKTLLFPHLPANPEQLASLATAPRKV